MKHLILITILTLGIHIVSAETAEPEPDRFKNSILVALLQMAPNGPDAQKNLEKAEVFCRGAAQTGADIALMPEMWNIGYLWLDSTEETAVSEWQSRAVSRDSEWVQHFRQLADELDMAIGVTYLEKWDGAPRNTLTLFDRHGQEVFTYAKVHTCDFAANEASTTPGTEWPVATLDTRKGPVEVGGMICYDREFPESARMLMVKGAEIVLTPNACELPQLRIDQFRVRALENTMAVVMTNYAAPYMNGRSVGFGPAGEPLGEAGPEETIQYVAVSLPDLRFVRERTIWGNAYRRPHRYDALTEANTVEVFKRKDLHGEAYDPAER